MGTSLVSAIKVQELGFSEEATTLYPSLVTHSFSFKLFFMGFFKRKQKYTTAGPVFYPYPVPILCGCCMMAPPPRSAPQGMIQYDPNAMQRHPGNASSSFDKCGSCGTYLDDSDERYSDEGSDDEYEPERIYGRGKSICSMGTKTHRVLVECYPNGEAKVNLHPFLRSGGLLLDMAEPVLLGQLADRGLSTGDLKVDATHYSLRQMNLYCYDFPWVLSVKNQNGVTVDQLLEFVHSELRMVARNQDMSKAKFMGAYAQHLRQNEGRDDNPHIQRIDYLEGKTQFCGLVPYPQQGPTDYLMVFQHPGTR
jgi:hypothetical protein